MKKKFSGFTLVELLVVSGIMIMILTIGMVNYNKINRRQVLKQQVKATLEELRLAQSKAINMEKPSSLCSGAQTLENYYFLFDRAHGDNTTTYEIGITCSGSETSLKTINFSGGVYLSRPNSFKRYQVIFPVLAQKIKLSPDALDTQEYRFQINGLSITNSIYVESSGQIYISN